MLPLYAAASFLASLLLLSVQPLAGKAILPFAGGAPAVWTGTMLFFQAALLVGYALAHILRNHPRSRWVVVCLVAGAYAWAGLVSAPIALSVSTPNAHPMLWVLLTLSLWLGGPVVAIAMLSPTLQHWLAQCSRSPSASPARDPYALSVASNLGSAAGLLMYPLAIEGTLTLQAQWRWWSIGLAIVGVLVAASALLVRPARPLENAAPIAAPTDPPAPPTPLHLLRWVALAFVPCSLMLGVTQHITTDIAPVPLLWVLPLLVYLLAFALAFAPRTSHAGAWFQSPARWARLLTIPLLALTLAMLTHARTPIPLVLGLHLLVYALGVLLCITSLAARKPPPQHLTLFYFALAIGGVLAGLAHALLAPMLFDRVLEYPIALALLAWVWMAHRPRNNARTHSLPRNPPRTLPSTLLSSLLSSLPLALLFSLLPALACLLSDRLLPPNTPTLPRSLLAGALPVLLIAASLTLSQRGFLSPWSAPLAMGLALLASQYTDSSQRVLHQHRTFFGVHRVVETSDRIFHQLMHGTTAHGVQASFAHPDFARLRLVPGAYYHPSGPIGAIMTQARANAPQQRTRTALIGLGTGAVAAYAQAGDHLTLLEIDEHVLAIAQDPRLFTFLADARARGVTLRSVVGDGRLTIAQEPKGSLDCIILDAFSSDAIPTHLLTREAIQTYVARLAPQGLLAIHVSNRAFDLAPVLERHAHDLRLAFYFQTDVQVSNAQLAERKLESWWVVLAHPDAPIAQLARDATWQRSGVAGFVHRPVTKPSFAQLPLWTDQRSNVLDVLLIGP